MPKFLLEASYTAEGLHGLAKDKASGRQAVVKEALTTIVRARRCRRLHPVRVSKAALSLAVSASAMVRTKAILLMTVEETDRALAVKLVYHAPIYLESTIRCNTCARPNPSP